ncbi:hypothetical protein V8G54_023597 [Vigna mungo]|uniref:Putative plant transposon protein domain-containing protein n=1 Tax=Vigna mungo TaxID=3915 RepID=A0AAQ3RSN9_VIGMU
MASSSNPKRVKTAGHKNDKEKKKKHSSFSHNFLSQKNEENFQVVQNRRLLMEVERLILDAYEFGAELDRRNWLSLLTYPEHASIAIVKEFYTNAQHFFYGEEPFLSYVRGCRVPFDAATINTFFNNQWPEDIASCEYSTARVDEFRDVDFEDVERLLCVPDGYFQRNSHGKPLYVRRSLLTPMNKYWVALMHANITPCSNVSNLLTSRVVLLCFILQGRQISLGQVIAKEIFYCAHSANPKAPLGYCLLDEEGLPIPTPQPPRLHRRRGQAHQDPPQQPHGPAQPAQLDHPAPHDSFSMVEMWQMMQQLDAKLEAVNRIGLAQAAMMRLTQLGEAMEEDGTEEEDSDVGTEILEEEEDSDAEEDIILIEVEDVDDDEDEEDDD